MPQDQSSPSPGLLRRLLGSLGINPVSEDLNQKWPELQKQWIGQEMESPEATSRVPKVMEMGPISKFLTGDAYAATGPFGTIALNREAIEKEKQDLGDVLAHELGHVEQGPSAMIKQFYQDMERGPMVKEAFRPRRKKDIYLRPK